MKKLIILSALIAVGQCNASDISQSEYAQGNNEVQQYRMTDITTQKKNHKWIEEDKRRLVESVNESKCGGRRIKWSAVSKHFPGISSANLKSYYSKCIKGNKAYMNEGQIVVKQEQPVVINQDQDQGQAVVVKQEQPVIIKQEQNQEQEQAVFQQVTVMKPIVKQEPDQENETNKVQNTSQNTDTKTEDVITKDLGGTVNYYYFEE